MPEKLPDKKNFFYSANSEAYQDGFLLWLFRNFDCSSKSEVSTFSKYFLESMVNWKKHTSIEVSEIIETRSQINKADVVVEYSDVNKTKRLLIIEDKTNSAVHKSKDYETQLEKYYDKFCCDKNYRHYFEDNHVSLIFYKSIHIAQEENTIINEANDRCRDKWFVNYYDKEIERVRKNIEKKGSKPNYVKSIEEFNNEKDKLTKRKKDEIPVWETMEINDIISVFKKFHNQSNGFNHILLKDYFNNLRELKRLLNNKIYPSMDFYPCFNKLSEHEQKVVGFAYLDKAIRIELLKIPNAIVEPTLWYIGGNDINIAMYVNDSSIAHLRITLGGISNIEKVTIKVAIYDSTKPDEYFTKHKKDKNEIKNKLQEYYSKNKELYPLKRIDTNRESSEKTIATTDNKSFAGTQDPTKDIINLIKKCAVQLSKALQATSPDNVMARHKDIVD